MNDHVSTAAKIPALPYKLCSQEPGSEGSLYSRFKTYGRAAAKARKQHAENGLAIGVWSDRSESYLLVLAAGAESKPAPTCPNSIRAKGPAAVKRWKDKRAAKITPPVPAAPIREAKKLRLVTLENAHDSASIQTRDYNLLKTFLPELAEGNDLKTHVLVSDLVELEDSFSDRHAETFHRVAKAFDDLRIDGFLLEGGAQ